MVRKSVWFSPVVITAIIIGGAVVLGLLSMGLLPNGWLKTQVGDQSGPGLYAYRDFEEVKGEVETMIRSYSLGESGRPTRESICTTAKGNVERALRHQEIKVRGILRMISILEADREAIRAKRVGYWSGVFGNWDRLDQNGQLNVIHRELERLGGARSRAIDLEIKWSNLYTTINRFCSSSDTVPLRSPPVQSPVVVQPPVASRTGAACRGLSWPDCGAVNNRVSSDCPVSFFCTPVEGNTCDCHE